MRKNQNIKVRVVALMGILFIVLLICFGIVKLTKREQLFSNNVNINNNPVDVEITDSYEGAKLTQGTEITLNVDFKVNDTSKPYYFLWQTYYNGTLNVAGTCRSVPNSTWKPTLTMHGTRKGTITIYSDNKCKNFVKTYSSRDYLCYKCTDKFTVEYNANGGKGSMANSIVTYGVAQPLRKNTFTNGSLSFSGWAVYNKTRQKWSCYKDTKHSTSGYEDKAICDKYGYVIYNDGQRVGKTVLPSEVAVMYAQWKNTKFTIEYNANGGKGSMANSIVTYGVAQSLRKNAFTKNNYYFLGWRIYNKTRQKWSCYTDNKHTVPAYTDKSVCEKNGYTLYRDTQSVAKTALPGETLTMYAKWQYNYKQGLKGFSGFEKDPTSGNVKATVWPVIKLNIRRNANSTSKILGTVKAGTALKVLDMTNKTNNSKSYVKISYNGVTGWIDGEYVMINLPDVIPSIVYDITNAYSSMYKNRSSSIKNVTGKNLYGANYSWYKYNPRLGYKQFLVPLRLPSAKKLQAVQSNALKYGNKIKVYDAFRPWAIQKLVRDNLKDSNFNGTKYCVTGKFAANRNSNGSTRCLYEYKGWFIALKLSSHNVAKAVDVSIVSSDDNVEIPTQTQMHELSGWAVPTESMVNKYPGEIAMNSLFTNAGFDYLISEWWHFEDDNRVYVSGVENLGKDDKSNHLDLAK